MGNPVAGTSYEVAMGFDVEADWIVIYSIGSSDLITSGIQGLPGRENTYSLTNRHFRSSRLAVYLLI